jgi:hypothetical protein
MPVSWFTDATLRDPALVTWGFSVLVGAIAASVGAVPPPMAGSRPRGAPLGAIRQPCPPAQEIERDPVSHLRSSANGRRRVVFWKSHSVAGVALEVVDHGCGFSAEDLRRRQLNGHVGLSLLQEWVAKAGAALAIVSTPGRGTTVRLQLAKS